MPQRRALALAAGLLPTLLAPNASPALSAAEFYARAQHSVILIHMLCFTKDGRNVEEYGSGFVLDEAGHVATARHVVADPSKCEGFTVEGSAGENAQANARWPMTLRATHDKADVAILQIDNYAAVKARWGLSGLALGTAASLRPGEEIYALGFPEGESLTITRGMITGRAAGMWRTDAPLNPGTSGGAVLLNAPGDPKAVATVKGALRYTSAGIPTEGWGYIVPIEATREILPAPPPPPPAAAPPPPRVAQIRLRERITMAQVTDKSVGPASIRYRLTIEPESGYQIRFVDLAPAFDDVRVLEYQILSSTPERTTLACEVSGDPTVMTRFREGDWANPNARLPIVATTIQTVRR